MGAPAVFSYYHNPWKTGEVRGEGGMSGVRQKKAQGAYLGCFTDHMLPVDKK